MKQLFLEGGRLQALLLQFRHPAGACSGKNASDITGLSGSLGGKRVVVLQSDKSCDVPDVGMRFGGCQSLALINAGVESDGSQPVAENAPGGIDAAGAPNVDEGKALGFEAAGDKCGKRCGHGTARYLP